MPDVLQTLQSLLQGRQHNRLLRLSFPHDDGPISPLLVNRLDAVESLSRDFTYTVELLSDNASLSLKDLQGKMLCVALVRGDGSLRYFTGYVFTFRLVKTDGSIATYEAILGPWLRYLTLRKDNFIYHHQTLRAQTENIFGDYGIHADWDWRIQGDDAEMTDAFQFDESDHNYLYRRWEDRGWHTWYEHTARGHKLIVSDDSTQAAPIDGSSDIRFQHHGGAQEEQGIRTWSPARHLVQSNLALASFDFKDPRPEHVDIPTVNTQGDVLPIESYEYTGAYGFKHRADGDQLARRRMEEIEAIGKHVDAAGNNTYVQPGRWFRLSGHFQNPLDADASPHAFLILSVHHVATNNYLNAGAASAYHNRLTCSRQTVPWRPGRGFNSVDTRIPGLQTAIVVGPRGQGSLHTDAYGRVCVQFHWDRVGGYDERSSTWLRVASSWAGGEAGFKALPRVGSEVLVQWLDGNPDRPIITSSVFNAGKMPPWQLPGQRALTGWRSRELTPDGGNHAAGRSNHLVFDDTHGKMQVQLKSDHEHSMLSMGSITRIEDNAGRKDAQGSGYYLFTQAWGVVRACFGMLITTEARPKARGAAKDMGETVQRLTAAHDGHAGLAELAQQHGAQEAGQQAVVAATIKAQNDSIKGTGASADHPFPELRDPHLLLASPAGIETTTAQSTHIASDLHTALTAGQNLSIAAGNSLFASIRQTWRLFVHRAGMKMVAAAGDIDMQALSNSINLLAKLNITQTADCIHLTAKKEVVINGGGSYMKLHAGGVDLGTPGAFVAHAATHSFPGPNSMSVDMPVILNPTTHIKNWIAVDYRDAEGAAMAGVGYKITFDSGGVISGKLDEKGHARHEHVPESAATVEYEKRPVKPDAPWDGLENMVQQAESRFSGTANNAKN